MRLKRQIKLRIEDVELTLYHIGKATIEAEQGSCAGYFDAQAKCIKVTGEGLELKSTVLHELFEALSFYRGIVYQVAYPTPGSMYIMDHGKMQGLMGDLAGLYEEVCAKWQI